MSEREIGETQFPPDRRYAEEHAWASVDTDGSLVTIGITDYAQDQLGELVWFGLPSIGADVQRNVAFAEAESMKTASDVISPCSGEVVAVNERLEKDPALVNRDPYGAGWIARIRVTDAAELDALMDANAYRAHVTS